MTKSPNTVVDQLIESALNDCNEATQLAQETRKKLQKQTQVLSDKADKALEKYQTL